MGWFIRFGLLRLRAKWRSLITLIVGVILAALIGANASLYTSAIAQVGLIQFLDLQSSADTNILARLSVAPYDEETPFADIWATRDSQVNQAADNTVGSRMSWVTDVTTFGETQAIEPLTNGEELSTARFRMGYYSGLFDRVELIDGRLPQDTSNPDIQAEALLNAEAAVLLDLQVGDVVELDQGGWETSRVFAVEIVGLVVPLDATESYWFDPSPLRVEARSTVDTNLLTTRRTLEIISSEYIPQTTTQIGWRIHPNYEQLPYTRIDRAANQVEQFSVALNEIFLTGEEGQGNYFYTTNIPQLMRDYDEQIVFLNIPFGLLLIQLAALVLFFVILIAALVRRGERREVAMFQSRGAMDSQVIFARSIESLLICIAATLIAPVLAQALLQQFIPILTGIPQIALELTSQAFLFAGGASLVAFIALTTTLFPVMRQPLVTAGGIGTRSGSQTIWQRYYLDVVLLIVGLVALYQLTQSQSVVATNVTESLQVDPLLLIAPTLLFVAFSSVLLRFFPFVMSFVSRVLESQRGIENVLASWQVSRQTLHYGRIAFLLALAIGIGWFAVSYQATLLSNQNDQASYQVGSDIRIVYSEPELPSTAASIRRIAALPDVQANTVVTRYELPSVIAITGEGRRSRQSGELLAINPETFTTVVDWRSDLGDLSVPASNFDLNAEIGVPIPDGTTSITFWARANTNANISFGNYTDELRPYPTLMGQGNLFTLRIQDTAETVYRFEPMPNLDLVTQRIEQLREELDLADNQFLWEPVDEDGDEQPDSVPRYEWENDGWINFEVDLSQVAFDGAANLFAMDVNLFPNSFFSNVELTIGALQFVDAAGNSTEINYNDQTIEILGFNNAVRPSTLNQITPEDTRFGQSALGADIVIFTGFNSDIAQYAMLFNYDGLSDVSTTAVRTATQDQLDAEAEEEQNIVGLPVLVSNTFADLNEFTPGQNFNLVVNGVSPWMTVDRILDYYPTLYQERPYIVVDASLLNYTLGRSTGSGVPPNELWIRLNANVDQAQFITDLRLSEDAPLFAEIVSADAIADTFETDVLSVGVIGLLFISFLIGLGLSVVSLLTYISLSMQARMGEFAVLRALGLTTSRLVVSIIVEQVLVLVAAIVLGAIIGQFLSVQVLPPLALSAAGGAVTPPFILTVDWIAIAQYLGVMILMLTVVLLLTALGIRRAATAETLRLTEE